MKQEIKCTGYYGYTKANGMYVLDKNIITHMNRDAAIELAYKILDCVLDLKTADEMLRMNICPKKVNKDGEIAITILKERLE